MPKWLLTPLQTLVSVLMFIEVSAVAGLALFLPVSGVLWLEQHLTPGPVKVLLLCMAGALAYFGYGLCLLVVVPLARWVTFATGTPLGKYPYVSFKGYQWASYNALILIVRYSFINWIRATPFNVFFYRLMGMNTGARVQINSAVVGDCNLITVGDDTVIGGDVTLIAHAVEGPNLVTAPVKIGARVTVGLMAVVMPGCEIGDGAVLAANAVLKKGTVVGPGEIWGGVPAVRVGQRKPKSAPGDAPAEAAAGEQRDSSKATT
jgi:acetyltransferase-like isoleucine patch superfamily enzyme